MQPALTGLFNGPDRSPLKLRDYQEQAHDAIALNFFAPPAQRAWRQLIVLPTGTGKTQIIAGLPWHAGIETWLASSRSDRRKILMIAHREELLEQAKSKIEFANAHLRVEIEQADRKASPNADVVIASVQSLAARAGRRMDRFDPDDFRIVIVDEAHHVTAPSYMTVLRYFGFIPPDDYMPLPETVVGKDDALAWQRNRLEAWDLYNGTRIDKLLLGVTATPKRGDNIGLEAAFQRVVFSRDIREMIKSGWLCPLRAFRIESTTTLDNVHTQAGDFAVGELADAINTEERNRLVVKGWGDYAHDRPTIAFCADVKHAKGLADTYIGYGIRAAAIYGELPSDDRKRILREFKMGDLQVLTNCNILTEGFDEPKVSCIVHARPTKSSLLYCQMSGRGTRLHDTKPDCIIIDVVDVTRRHSLVTAPELIGLPANFNAKGEDLLKVAGRIEEIKAQTPHLSLQDARSIDEIELRAQQVDLFNQFNAPELQQHATLTWLKESNEAYQITFPNNKMVGNERVDIRQNALGQWDIIHTALDQSGHTVTEAPVLPPQVDLPTALRISEDWLAKNREHVMMLKRKAAKWRGGQASDAQVEWLKRLGVMADFSKLSKGEASDLIELHKTKHKSMYRGNRVQFKKR